MLPSLSLRRPHQRPGEGGPLNPLGKIADMLLSKIAPKAEASAAGQYTEFSCNPPPWAPHCGSRGDLMARTCGDSWCGNWHWVACCS